MSNIIDLLNEHSILIPAMQRDYAYGRNSEKDKREGLVSAIFDVLTEVKSSIRLNYIYGVPQEDNRVVLIDGQQRTTTLFLVRLFLSVNASNTNLDFCDNFSYETRTTSKAFCAFLKEAASLCLKYKVNDSTVSERFENSKKFFKKWRNDPTVDSMITVLDSIQLKIKEIYPDAATIPDFDFWIDRLKNIEFEFVLLEGFKRTESLYTAMNGRGKQLTEFEKLKPTICEKLKNFDTNIEDTINNVWIPEFWKYSLYKSEEQPIPAKFAAANHDRFLFNYFKYVATMLWLERKPYSKGDLIPNIKQIIEELSEMNDDACDFLIFSMQNFQHWFVDKRDKGFYLFKSDISVTNLIDKSENKTNLFWNLNKEIDFVFDCVSSNELSDFNLVELIMLWAYLCFKWQESKQQLNNKTLRDYYVLMRDIYAASWDSNTPNAITKNPSDHLVIKGIKAFRDIIAGNDSKDYAVQKATFVANNNEKYRILNNYCTRGCSNNIADVVAQANGFDLAKACIFRENIDMLIENIGADSFQIMDAKHYINEGNMVHRLYLPCTKYLLQSMFSMKSWKNENWYEAFIQGLCDNKLSLKKSNFNTKEWQYYIVNYFADFVLDESLAAFDFEVDSSSNPKWFEVKGVYGLKATARQIASPFCLAAFRKKTGLKGKIKKEHISKFQKYAENHNFSLSYDGTTFTWFYNNQSYTCDGSNDIIEYICEKITN